MSDRSHLPMNLTAKLIVKLDTGGLQVQVPATAEMMPLEYFQAETLSLLDAGSYTDTAAVAEIVSERTGIASERVEKYLKSLTRTGRLRRRKVPVPVRPLLLDPVHATAQDTVLGDGSLVSLKLPQALRLYEGEYQIINHDGALVVDLTPAEVFLLSQFVRPTRVEDVISSQEKLLGSVKVEHIRLSEIVGRLHSERLVTVTEQSVETSNQPQHTASSKQVLKENFARQALEQDEREAARREANGGAYRSKIIPVSFGEAIPAALGLVLAYAKVYRDGLLDEFYDIRLDWFWDDDRIETFTANPAIYLFSNYLWTHENSIAVSEKIKQLSPGSITIHGGPDTPKYEQDAIEYFEQFPHVDIIIRGEGEGSAADTLDKLRSVIGDENPDLSVLADVPGISYRYKGEVFRNPDRERITDLNVIPSPYLMGLFEVYDGVPNLHVTLETNRGCPYGCTFCDWGSATTSKIRKFDLERVFGELTWCSEKKVQSVSQADANFGVFERDVEIARHVGELKKKTGYPEAFGGSYAKNSTKYLEEIIRLMADAGILTQGVLSLQTMDDSTLAAINRSNIKVSKYDALANEMRSSNLQLSVELMMGLPGATLQSFVDDLQQCIDRDIQARINHTTMLVNAPMNNPDYREEHQIETGTALGPGKMPVLVSTRTYTRDDLVLMSSYRQLYMLMDNFGVLRYLARFVRQEIGITEMEFYQEIWSKAAQGEQQYKWPMLNAMANYGQFLMAPLYSWALFYAEVREFVIEELGLAADSSLNAVIQTQHAIMPAHGRQYPHEIELAHDVVAWNQEVINAKSQGSRSEWQNHVPRLAEFAPGQLKVNDVNGSVAKTIGCSLEINSNGVNWDMDSGLARARVDMDFQPAFLVKEDVIQVG